MRACEVGPRFNARQLPPHLECYTMLPGRMVVVQNSVHLILVICQPPGRLICDCAHFVWKRNCPHAVSYTHLTLPTIYSV